MKWRRWWRWALAVPIVAATIFGAAALSHGSDDYAFLNGHGTTEVGVIPPGSWGPKEIRVYTWKQHWMDVAAAAELDLKRSGLGSRRPGKGRDQLEWSSTLIDGGPCGIGASTWVTIAKGRARPLRSAWPLTDGDPEWVTVLINGELDESWINVIRYTFFSLR